MRNIQRKATEGAPTIPSLLTEFDSTKGDSDTHVNNLVQENLQYKMFHKTLLTQVHFIENKMRDLKTEIHVLHSEQQKLKTNEEFLKNVVKQFSKVFGGESIKKIIEAENLNFSVLHSNAINIPDANHQEMGQNLRVNQNYPIKTPFISANTHPHYEEMDIIRKIQHIEERGIQDQYLNKYPSLNNYSLPCAYSETDHSNEESYRYQQGHKIADQINSWESDQIDNTNSEHSETYANWLAKFEKQQLGADAFLGSAANREFKNMEMDELFNIQNQLISGGDF